MTAPAFLYLQLSGAGANMRYLEALAAMAGASSGRLLGMGARNMVERLEPGTTAAELALLQFEQADAARQLWHSDENRQLLTRHGLAGEAGTLALLVPGLPYAGLPEAPEIPTVASVTPPADRGPRCYMVIQGTGADPERLDRYRDVILPMIAEQGGYYIAFDIEGGAQALSGAWPWEIFAVSRWPDHRAGHAFWDSERYQQVAKPMRAGAGTFLVHFFEGAAG